MKSSPILVDVTNFNADASCLWAEKWLYCLQGGYDSLFCKFLENYINYSRKVNLGLTGVTIRDLLYFNPEAIELINDHPDIFELIYRPFSHDSPLLRTPLGFKKNLEKGISIIKETFKNVSRFYLPPEHMQTGEQIKILKETGVIGTFIYRNRYDAHIAKRIPTHAYKVKGVMGNSLLCIPFNQKEEYSIFLDVLHGHLSPDVWVDVLEEQESPFIFWRDAESCFLFPMGVELEGRFLKKEKERGIKRVFLSELDIETREVQSSEYYSFAYQSLRPWFKDMKLYWLTSRLQAIEIRLEEYSEVIQSLWMLTINSDIMASAEKSFPVISVTPEVFSVPFDSFQWIGVESYRENNKLCLIRSERAAEGEDYLAYLGMLIEDESKIYEVLDEWKNTKMPHLKKAYARILPDLK